MSDETNNQDEPESWRGPKPRPGILDIEAYKGGASSIDGHDRVIKLSSNESALGPSPKAVQAFEDAKAKLPLYPDGSAFKLRQAIGDHYGLSAERIVCGAGSDEILHLLVQAFAGPGDEVLYSQHGFLVYKIAAMANGATPVAAPEKDNRADVDALLARVTERTRILFIANPNNPTGTYLRIDELKRLHAALPEHVLLVIDAAYAEFVRQNDYEAGIEIVSGAHNAVMTRTFSKIYGLAGLRLGWAYCPQRIADVINRIRGPFNISEAAQAAGIAALRDTSYTERAIAHNDAWLPWLNDRIRKAGLKTTPSVGNFILIHFPDTRGKRAADADVWLKRNGIIARKVDAYGFPNALRVSVGREEENRAVVAALEEFMAQ